MNDVEMEELDDNIPYMHIVAAGSLSLIQEILPSDPSRYIYIVYCIFNEKRFIKIGETSRHPLTRFEEFKNSYNCTLLIPIMIFRSTYRDLNIEKIMKKNNQTIYKRMKLAPMDCGKKKCKELYNFWHDGRYKYVEAFLQILWDLFTSPSEIEGVVNENVYSDTDFMSKAKFFRDC